jgi:hypothetical protein
MRSMRPCSSKSNTPQKRPARGLPAIPRSAAAVASEDRARDDQLLTAGDVLEAITVVRGLVSGGAQTSGELVKFVETAANAELRKKELKVRREKLIWRSAAADFAEACLRGLYHT